MNRATSPSSIISGIVRRKRARNPAGSLALSASSSRHPAIRMSCSSSIYIQATPCRSDRFERAGDRMPPHWPCRALLDHSRRVQSRRDGQGLRFRVHRADRICQRGVPPRDSHDNQASGPRVRDQGREADLTSAPNTSRLQSSYPAPFSAFDLPEPERLRGIHARPGQTDRARPELDLERNPIPLFEGWHSWRGADFHDQPVKGPLASCGRLAFACAVIASAWPHTNGAIRAGIGPLQRWSRACSTIFPSPRNTPGTSPAPS